VRPVARYAEHRQLNGPASNERRGRINPVRENNPCLIGDVRIALGAAARRGL